MNRQRQTPKNKETGPQPVILWLTGLSAAGKSTIANNLHSQLGARGYRTYVLDGDKVRSSMNSDLNFSAEDRKENIRRVGEMAQVLVNTGIIPIVALISPYRQARKEVRLHFPAGDFIEIYVKASVAVCEKRDPKGLYQKARQGAIREFTGISAPYEEPENPEIVVDTECHTIDESIQQILKYLKEREIIHR